MPKGGARSTRCSIERWWGERWRSYPFRPHLAGCCYGVLPTQDIGGKAWRQLAPHHQSQLIGSHSTDPGRPAGSRMTRGGQDSGFGDISAP
eukprot:COSAG01_NODE_8386_length_2805_cov_5.632299_2_plen_91_part_00